LFFVNTNFAIKTKIGEETDIYSN